MEITREELHNVLRETSVKMIVDISKKEDGIPDIEFALSLTKMFSMFCGLVETKLFRKGE